MNIGFFTDTYFPQISGVSTSIRILRDQLVEKGHRVIIFTTTDPDADTSEPDVVRLPSIPFVSFEDRRIAYSGFDKALRIARQYDLDIVHTHTEFSLGLAGQYVATRLRIPIIHTYHTMYEKYTHYILDGQLVKPEHVRAMSRVFCQQVHGVISPSLMTYETLREYGVNTEMRIIPTGVKIPAYNQERRQLDRAKYGFTEDDFILLSLSRVSKEKNIHQLIEQFDEINHHHPQAHFVIVGDGPARSELEDLAKTTKSVENIHFLGEVSHDEVSRFYQMADLYVNASDSESQGLTYLEAMVNRLPICARYNDYLAEIIAYSEDLGVLFDPSEDYAPKVIQFLDDRNNSEKDTIPEEALTEISAETFVNSVLQFYLDTKGDLLKYKSPFVNRLESGVKGLIRDIIIGDET
ncbi:glycosyltransferase family 4 protein [Aerococcaceae bacterium DSM 111176]|nr:glycosyltransferase family 4 protein [Aerococcaceae bacterium DSM 111176]